MTLEKEKERGFAARRGKEKKREHVLFLRTGPPWPRAMLAKEREGKKKKKE